MTVYLKMRWRLFCDLLGRWCISVPNYHEWKGSAFKLELSCRYVPFNANEKFKIESNALQRTVRYTFISCLELHRILMIHVLVKRCWSQFLRTFHLQISTHTGHWSWFTFVFVILAASSMVSGSCQHGLSRFLDWRTIYTTIGLCHTLTISHILSIRLHRKCARLSRLHINPLKKITRWLIGDFVLRLALHKSQIKS